MQSQNKIQSQTDTRRNAEEAAVAPHQNMPARPLVCIAQTLPRKNPRNRLSAEKSRSVGNVLAGTAVRRAGDGAVHVLPGFADEIVDAVAYRRQQDEEDDDDDGNHVVLFHRGGLGGTVPRGRVGLCGWWCCGGGGNSPGGGWSLDAEPGGSLGLSSSELLELECAGRVSETAMG